MADEIIKNNADLEVVGEGSEVDLTLVSDALIVNAVSPRATVTQTETGATITITDYDGVTAAEILNGEKGDKGDTPEISATASTLTPGSAATVEKTVDPETGAVSLAFGIPEGQRGETGPQGIPGEPGETGPQGEPGQDGFSPTATVTQTATGATISITDAEGTTTAEITNGQDGETGPAGANGEDGFSPTVTVTDIEGGHRITITDADGPHSIDVMDGTGSVQDVQVNGTSVVQDGVANVPIGGQNSPGVVGVVPSFGISLSSTNLILSEVNDTTVKDGTSKYYAITPKYQHKSVFYGLAKAAGDTTQSASSNAVGTYTDNAKSAISTMLNAPVTVPGTTPTITALAGVQYVCGEVSTLDITPPASGCFDVIFESGSTPTALNISNPTGTTVEWSDGFDTSNLAANTVYEINLLRIGTKYLGVAASWT